MQHDPRGRPSYPPATGALLSDLGNGSGPSPQVRLSRPCIVCRRFMQKTAPVGERSSAFSVSAGRVLEATPRFELGIKALQASALPLGYVAVLGGMRSPSCEKADLVGPVAHPWADLRRYRGADDGTRTRDPNLGKVVLYQLSHVRAQRVDYHGI